MSAQISVDEHWTRPETHNAHPSLYTDCIQKPRTSNTFRRLDVLKYGWYCIVDHCWKTIFANFSAILSKIKFIGFFFTTEWCRILFPPRLTSSPHRFVYVLEYVITEIIEAQISLVKNYVMKLCQSTQGRKQTPPRGMGGELGIN